MTTTLGWSAVSLDVKARPCWIGMPIAAKYPGVTEQHHCQCPLRPHQPAAHAPANRAFSAATCFMKRFLQSQSRRLKRRNKTENDARQQGDEGRETEHRRIEGGFVEARMRHGVRSEKSFHTTRRHHHTESAAQQGQQKTLGEKLTDQASTSGAQSSADRQLLLSRHSPGKQQIGHIDTSDDQQQPDRNEENQQSLLRLSRQLFSQ